MVKIIKARKRAFTLVELLVVVMVIGILAGMILLNALAASHKAEAANVINDLRNLKGATVMFFMDEGVWPSGDPGEGASLDRYLDHGFTATGKYSAIRVLSGDVRYLIGVTLCGKNASDGVKKMLAAISDKVGLYEDVGVNYSGYSDTVYVYMK
ncbi:MAG: prepilin-type N-terminal cleavage/methylation domain-containing protein [Synergistaceae bacterium]|jgi:general secretion pathway protein G|nr:prepilin-type N-terminal cleavage/methylation domain-containing protein [Synergistaceae bacterium]